MPPPSTMSSRLTAKRLPEACEGPSTPRQTCACSKPRRDFKRRSWWPRGRDGRLAPERAGAIRDARLRKSFSISDRHSRTRTWPATEMMRFAGVYRER